MKLSGLSHLVFRRWPLDGRALPLPADVHRVKLPTSVVSGLDPGWWTSPKREYSLW
jgi:hypothetical protein